MTTINLRLIALLFCLGVTMAVIFKFNHGGSVQACVQDYCVNTQVVSKMEDMRRGLQGRAQLAADQGMLFIFPKEDQHRFWMKDMLINLDIIWLDSFGKIVSIGENLPVCTVEPCTIYAPAAQARYVLEVKAGFAREHGLKMNDTVVLKGL